MINFYKGNLFSPRLKISRYFGIAEGLPALRPTVTCMKCLGFAGTSPLTVTKADAEQNVSSNH